VNATGISRKRDLGSAKGAALAVLCGLLFWIMPPGRAWTNASYDYLFLFASRPATNSVTFIMMDNEAFDFLRQNRTQPWNRALHARLLNKLADDGCSLVVMDSFFRELRTRTEDEALAAAMKRLPHLVLMARQAEITLPTLAGMHPLLPTEPFYSAAGTNWGVACLDPSDPDLIVRRHWPFPSPGPYPSLPEAAARLAGVELSESPERRWLRYYGQEGVWKTLSYRFALTQPTNFYRNQIVFIGTRPETSLLDGQPDKFRTPYTRWTSEASGGTEILITSFLNLVRRDWLRRAPDWVEVLILVLSGTLLGGGLSRLRPLAATACAVAAAAAVLVGAVSCSYFTNYWFPWLLVAGCQAPCALAWALALPLVRRQVAAPAGAPGAAAAEEPVRALPPIPGYKLLPTPFGQGAYGSVWLARNAAGQWRAVKVIYLANFKRDRGPYDREFMGISRYQAISDQHPSLLRVDFVSEKMPDYFYYVMELGDPLEAGWERDPSTYKPRDLAGERTRAKGGRLPTRDCLRLGLELSDALDFLHRQGLTHRDIKPQNIIYVNGRPKLADLGLIAEIRPPDQERTLVGTPGYMPPSPELPGTPQSDIYALGVVLYVLSTGRAPSFFPEISTTLAGNIEAEEFFVVNTIILKACQQDPAQRYASAREMHRALLAAQISLENGPAGINSPAAP
jgi:CHASE2 domain-containing sensor protein